jgi:DNA-binding transcriptional ArsR family regulator
MDKKVAEHAAETLKVMAHPFRLQIVELLQAKEMCVGDIVEALTSKQAITSQQLNMMKDKGVLSCRHEGTRVYYHIENKNVIKLLHCFDGQSKRKRD